MSAPSRNRVLLDRRGPWEAVRALTADAEELEELPRRRDPQPAQRRLAVEHEQVLVAGHEEVGVAPEGGSQELVVLRIASRERMGSSVGTAACSAT